MKDEIPEEYKTGFIDFLGCKINLSGRPLIPRPETEFWVGQAILDLTDCKKTKIHVLDIFSGSGCAGIAVAKKLPGALVDFADIDKGAVAQIKINLEANFIAKEQARIFKSDIFDDIPKGAGYDTILANPPYINPARIGEVQKSVLDWEPWHAFFAPESGLLFIKKFLAGAKKFLKTGGFIYLEFDPAQKQDIMKLIKADGYSSRKFFKDQFGRWRFVKILK